MEKTNCFGFDVLTCKCRVLTETVCKNANCPFFKTYQQFADDAVNAALILERKREGEF